MQQGAAPDDRIPPIEGTVDEQQPHQQPQRPRPAQLSTQQQPFIEGLATRAGAAGAGPWQHHEPSVRAVLQYWSRPGVGAKEPKPSKADSGKFVFFESDP